VHFDSVVRTISDLAARDTPHRWMMTIALVCVGVSHLELAKSLVKPTNGLYYGLAFGPDQTLYAAQGAADSVLVVGMNADGELTRRDAITTRKGDFPSGLAVDAKGHLYVANNDNHGVGPLAFKLPGSIAIYDTAEKKEIGRFEFTESFGGTPNFPMAVAVLKDGSKLYVASQRDSAVYVLDTSNPAQPKQVATLSTGSHPVAMLLDKAQARLFVANAQSRHRLDRRYANRHHCRHRAPATGDRERRNRRDTQWPCASHQREPAVRDPWRYERRGDRRYRRSRSRWLPTRRLVPHLSGCYSGRQKHPRGQCQGHNRSHAQPTGNTESPPSVAAECS